MGLPFLRPYLRGLYITALITVIITISPSEAACCQDNNNHCGAALSSLCQSSYLLPDSLYICKEGGDPRLIRICLDGCQTRVGGNDICKHVPTASQLLFDTALKRGQSLFSPDKKTKLSMQMNGDLVVSIIGEDLTEKSVWSTGTSSLAQPPVSVNLLKNGDLVMLIDEGETMWRLGTAGMRYAGASLWTQDTMNHLVSCFVLQMMCFLFLAGKGHSASPTVTKQETLGWEAIEVSPKAFILLGYGNFQVSIYKKEGSDDSSSQQFYYSPALILQPNSTKTHYNYFTETFETVFQVKIWYPEYLQAIQTALSSEVGWNVSKHSIRMLPIEEIRIESGVRSEKYYIANKWTFYANQPSTFTFRIACLTNETCIEVAENIRHHPEVFTSGLEVFYSLQTHRTEKRSVEIKFQHMQRSELFGKMLRKFPNEDTIYLPVADLKKIELEVSSNVIASEIKDNNSFVSSDEAVNVARHLEELMEVEKVGSIERFD
ncbi:hypothetical protein BV898_14105 [Hypsibius exemplaris]|uniref:Bulb-type lectin domain-containing protein n=1 Tax=Hypsibius exemplaris TaxID=2072580 RepID=A0A1W0W8S9_HYPEX|nr:hypothetical protein BV898_14105 [Hypsibius exemplaris]